MATRLDDLPRVPIDSRAQWRAWLQRDGASFGARNERANQWQRK
jgi:hypothetical protein